MHGCLIFEGLQLRKGVLSILDRPGRWATQAGGKSWIYGSFNDPARSFLEGNQEFSAGITRWFQRARFPRAPAYQQPGSSQLGFPMDLSSACFSEQSFVGARLQKLLGL
jgi:hypothetical protein